MINISPYRVASGILALVLVLGAWTLGGCERNLFIDSDAGMERRARYWDGESVRETTESRKQASQMGFGFPTGGGMQ